MYQRRPSSLNALLVVVETANSSPENPQVSSRYSMDPYIFITAVVP